MFSKLRQSDRKPLEAFRRQESDMLRVVFEGSAAMLPSQHTEEMAVGAGTRKGLWWW